MYAKYKGARRGPNDSEELGDSREGIWMWQLSCCMRREMRYRHAADDAI